jgi:hypothetical protein
MSEEIYTREAGQSTISAISFKQRGRAGLFAKVPLEVATTRELSPAAKQVWITLACLQGDNGHSWPGLQTLARFACLSLSRTKEAIAELRGKGFLMHKYDAAKRRHSFVLQIPTRAIEECSKRTGLDGLLAQVQSAPQPSAPTREDFRPKAQGQGNARREVDPRAEFEVFQDVTPPEYLRKKYERARGEDDEWNGLSTVSAAQSAVQNENQAAGTESRTGEAETSYWGVRNPVLGSTETRTPVEGSAQTGTAKAGAYKTFIDKTLENTSDKNGENLLKSPAPNGQESKSEENFQLGEEEKVGLEPKSSSAEPDVSETKASEGNPPAVLVDSSLSAGNPAPSTSNRSLIVDPETGRVTNYANLPPWARHMVAGLLNLRRERESLLGLLPGARGAELVMLRARIQELEEEIAYNETRLSALLSQDGAQTSGAAEAAVAVGGEARG